MTTLILLLFNRPTLAQNVTQVEYFTDTDPGYGLGINVPITPEPNFSDLVFPIDLTAISPGFHNLYVRSKDEYLKWSLTAVRPFYKESPNNLALPNIIQVEYFIDNDPGNGLATNAPIVPGTNLSNLVFPIDIGAIAPGFHNLYVRSKDAYLKWSLTAVRPFYKETAGMLSLQHKPG